MLVVSHFSIFHQGALRNLKMGKLSHDMEGLTLGKSELAKFVLKFWAL
jgi:hypothetical protein